jgi:hypothetical protein
MQTDKQTRAIDLIEATESDSLLKDAISHLTGEQEIDGWFPPSCEKGGVQE